MPLIQAVRTDEWWQDVTVPLLEVMRRRLRALVQFIDKDQRKIVYTEFEDEHGIVEAGTLYASPFTDVMPHGPDGLFAPTELDALPRTLDAVRASAVVA